MKNRRSLLIFRQLRYCFLLSTFISLMISTNCKAGDITTLVSLNGSGICNNAFIFIKDTLQKKGNLADSLQANLEKTMRLRLRFAETNNTYYSTPQTYIVNCIVKLYSTTDTTRGAARTTNESLTITIAPGGSSSQCEQHVFEIEYAGYQAMSTRITSITLNSNTITSISPTDIFLEEEYTVDRLFNLNISKSPGVTISGAPSSGCIYQNTTPRNELTVSWNYLLGSESYDLEWLFIDIGDPLFCSNFNPSNTHYDFRNATRVNVSTSSYKIPLAYPQGVLLVRVRSVGRYQDATNNVILRKESKWSLPDTGRIGTIGNPKPYIKYAGLSADSNWQYMATYVEGGKRKEIISYYDGTLRLRQQSTTMSTDTFAIVKETIYDHLGRNAIEVMPAPAKNRGNRFYYNTQDTSKLMFNGRYNRLNFDRDSCYKYAKVDTMNNNFGASKYYSYKNPFRVSSKPTIVDYVPDAGGFPFSQTRYMNDGTGNIHSQTIYGASMSLDSGRATRYYYGRPAGQAELDRLFGSEVGYVSHYQKNMVVDPNGQVSLTYLDQEGRTIASCLAGSGADTARLKRIDSEPSGGVNIPVNLMDNNAPSVNNEMIASTVVLISVPYTTYHFNYSLSSNSYCHNCLEVCPSCIYRLRISIVNNESGLVVHNDSSIIRGNSNYNFDYTFPEIGSYKIIKKTSLYEDTISAVKLYFLENATCLEDVDIIPEPCIFSCDSACYYSYRRIINNQWQWVNDTGAIVDSTVSLSLIANCKSTVCSENTTPYVSECDLKLEALLEDMSPGGQYFDNITYNSDSNEFVSEFSDRNVWLLNNASILLLTSNPNYQELADSSVASMTPADGWDFLRTHWSPSYAKDLVRFHPEYCMYLYFCECFSNKQIPSDALYKMNMRVFDSTMYVTQNDSLAYLLGLMNPLALDTNTSHGDITSDHSNYMGITNIWTRTIGSKTFFGDPYFWDQSEYNCLGNYGQVTDSIIYNLQHYIKTDSGDYSIWYFLDDPDNIHLSAHDSISPYIDDLFHQMHNVLLPALANNGNGKFFFFKMVYNFYKERIIHSLYNNCAGGTSLSTECKALELVGTRIQETSCPCGQYLSSNYSQAGYITDNGYSIRFISNNALSGSFNPDSIQAGIDSTLNTNACNMCNSKLDSWMQEIGSCINQSFQDTVRHLLYEICYAGRSNDFLYGRDNCSPATVSYYDGQYHYFSSFQDVLAYFHGISNVNCPNCPTIQHPTPIIIANGACSCNSFSTFLDNYNQNYSSNIDSIRITLDAAFDSTFNNTDIIRWISHCQGDSLSNDSLRNFNFPQAFLCPESNTFTYEDYIQQMMEECHERAEQDAWLEEQSIITAELTDSLYSFINGYRQNCLENLYSHESFSATYTNYEFQYTLYYYDQAGNLIKTVPPAGVSIISNPLTLDTIDHNRRYKNNAVDSAFKWPGHTMVTNYVYNSLNQITRQYTPDGDTVKSFYDILGRTVASQNKNQYSQIPKRYSITKYDPLGRMIVSSEKRTDTTLTNITVLQATRLNNFMNSGTDYDNFYTYFDKALNTAIYPSTSCPTCSFTQDNLQNRVACIAYYGTKPATSSDSLNPDAAYHYSYDVHGNVKTQIQEQKYLVLYGWRFVRTDYDYEIGSGNVTLLSYQEGLGDRLFHKYKYDADNRLIQVQTSTNARKFGYVTDARYYYYPHGPLARTELGNKQVQGIDYIYTLNGWIKAVNSSTIDTNRDAGADGKAALYYGSTGTPRFSNTHKLIANDAYSYSLEYFKGDYKPICSVVPVNNLLTAIPANCGFDQAIKSDGLYNGNITGNIVSFRKVGDSSAYLQRVYGYAYQYDRLNRIKLMQTCLDASGSVQNNNTWYGVSATAHYKNSYTYDANGNILTLNRNDQSGNSLDRLVYNYFSGTNMLRYIQDNAGVTPTCSSDMENQTTTNYTYDSIGNLTRDVITDAKTINWTVFGKLASVYKYNNKRYSFLYDALARRTVKYNQVSQVSTYTTYDPNGNILGIYEMKTGSNGYLNLYLKEQPIYGSGRLGVILPDRALSYYTTSGCTVYTPPSPTIFTATYCNRRYELTNHLGNVMVTITDKRKAHYVGTKIDFYYPTVVSTIDYYPFGMEMPGRIKGDTSYRFGFNGQMQDNEFAGKDGAHLEFEFREYDSRICRFWKMDPLFKQYPWNSTYAFAENRPIDGIDLEGAEWQAIPVAIAATEVLLVATGVVTAGYIIKKADSKGIELTPEAKSAIQHWSKDPTGTKTTITLGVLGTAYLYHKLKDNPGYTEQKKQESKAQEGAVNDNKAHKQMLQETQVNPNERGSGLNPIQPPPGTFWKVIGGAMATGKIIDEAKKVVPQGAEKPQNNTTSTPANQSQNQPSTSGSYTLDYINSGQTLIPPTTNTQKR